MTSTMKKQDNITSNNLRIIYKQGRFGISYPSVIRDSTGLLFEFKRVTHFDGQQPRYEKEIFQQRDLADYLLSCLEKRYKE